MYKKQQGVALIMTLVFLVLMTLVSTSAMQQNTLQFTMAGNVQEQNKSFSRAENILKSAENEIKNLRWSEDRFDDPDNDECQETEEDSGVYGLIAPGTDLGVIGATAVVTGWWCENNPDDIDDNLSGEAAECSTDDAVCPDIPTTGFAPSPNTSFYGPGTACDNNPNLCEVGCGTELYTVKVTYLHEPSQTERSVESKYAIRCLKTGAGPV